MVDMLMENLSQFHFLRPMLLVLLILPLAFWLLFIKQKVLFSSWEKACDSNLLQYLLIQNSDSKKNYGKKLFCIGLVISVLSVAGPTWQKRENPILLPQNPIMFLLNLSSDMQKTDISPSRLDRAKFEISDILKQLPEVESGLIVYTSEPFIISPLSRDSNLLINLLDFVSRDIMPVNGDNLARAIDFAVEKIKSAGFNRGNIVVLAAEAGLNEKSSIAAAQNAVSSGINVSVVGFSSFSSLKNVAQSGQGVFVGYPFNNTQKLVDFIKQHLSNELEKSKNLTQSWQDYGYYLVFPAMLCFLFLFRKGFLVLLLVFCFLPSAHAGWLWSDEYEALKLFKLQKYDQAANLFTDKDWRGAALYRAGNYEAAIPDFSNESNIETLYNKGNALAKSGKIEEAIATYEAVLKKQPEHEDAKFNLEYLKQQKQQQQKQNQNNKQNQDDKDKQKQQQQQESAANANAANQEDKEQNQQNLSEKENTAEQNNSKQNADNSSEDKHNKEAKSQAMQPEPKQPKEKAQDAKQDKAFGVSNEKSPDDKYDEKVQAREQRYRNIPEDKGGLLRAFIQKEYNKNRYGE